MKKRVKIMLAIGVSLLVLSVVFWKQLFWGMLWLCVGWRLLRALSRLAPLLGAGYLVYRFILKY